MLVTHWSKLGESEKVLGLTSNLTWRFKWLRWDPALVILDARLVSLLPAGRGDTQTTVHLLNNKMFVSNLTSHNQTKHWIAYKAQLICLSYQYLWQGKEILQRRGLESFRRDARASIASFVVSNFGWKSRRLLASVRNTGQEDVHLHKTLSINLCASLDCLPIQDTSPIKRGDFWP